MSNLKLIRQCGGGTGPEWNRTTQELCPEETVLQLGLLECARPKERIEEPVGLKAAAVNVTQA